MPYDAQKPTIDSLALIREVLDHARTVDEAIVILDKYNIDWGGGPALHYLIADITGMSILVEFWDGKRVIIPNNNPWHLANNHLRCNIQGDGGCMRYAMINQLLETRKGKLFLPDAMQLLEDVSQAGDYPTQWSVIYGISTGEITVVMGRNYDKRHTFNIPLRGK